MNNFLEKRKTFDSASQGRQAGRVVLAANLGNRKPGGFRVFTLACLCLLLSGGYFNYVRNTLSYFSDTASAGVAQINAASLGFTLHSPEDWDPEKIKKHETSEREVDLVLAGSLDFDYSVKAVITSQDSALCDGLNLSASLGEDALGGADLAQFNTGPLDLTSTSDSWQFTLSFDKHVKHLKGTVCDFDLVFTGWQKNGLQNSGFNHVETLHNTIAYGNSDEGNGGQNQDWEMPSDQQTKAAMDDHGSNGKVGQ